MLLLCSFFGDFVCVVSKPKIGGVIVNLSTGYNIPSGQFQAQRRHLDFPVLVFRLEDSTFECVEA